LLDTHALVWALSSPSRLPKALRTNLVDPAVQVAMSAANAWEIAIKAALGKIDADVEEVIASSEAAGFVELPVRSTHAATVAGLPMHHRDPFDRMLIAQSLVEGYTIVTRDPIFDSYVVQTLWG
jgi:PIN domain nuclease of toxin-antitoxin system